MKRITYIYLITPFLLLACYFFAWRASLGGYQEAEYWLKNVYAIKVAAAESISAPKLIIASGSNSLFGIDSEMLYKLTGTPAVNMAGHAGVTFDYLASKVVEVVEYGDIVVMPLEYTYYKRTDDLSGWQVANMLTWGSEYVKDASFSDIWRYFISSSAIGTASRLNEKIHGVDLPIDPIDITFAYTEDNDRQNQWQGYSYKSMNHLGDILADEATILRIANQEKGFDYLDNPKVSDEFISSARQLEESLESRGAFLYLTWPVSIQGERFNINKPVFYKRAVSLRDNLKNEGLNMICDPRDYNMDVKYFFNTTYHLNSAGARLRTRRLAECLNEKVL